ncbi:hypothetical protein N9878_01210 [bacterium]|nr:hypothetical protein [bacterium]
MTNSITRKGRWAVVGGTSVVSTHNTSIEACEAALNWSAANGGATARIDPPFYEAKASVDVVVVEPEPVPPSVPVPTPEPEPSDWPVDERPILRTVELGPGEQVVDIDIAARSPHEWVVVRGTRDSIITGLNRISTPSLIRFEGVTIKAKMDGATGGEFAFIDCEFDVKDSVCWGVSKAWVHGCYIKSYSNVFAGGVPTYDARDNVVEYYVDLFRGGFNSTYINTTVIKHGATQTSERQYHPDVFEVARHQGFHDVLIDGVYGPSGTPVEFGYTQGIAGGDISDSTIRNFHANFTGEGGIHAVQIGGKWDNVHFDNVVFRGATIAARNDSGFIATNCTIRNSPGLEVIPGFQVIE